MNNLMVILNLKEKDWVKNNFDSIPLFGKILYGNFVLNQLECQQNIFDELSKYLLDNFQMKEEEHYIVQIEEP